MQTPLIITHSELPTRSIVDYEALAQLVQDLGPLLLPLDTPHLECIRSRMFHHGIFSRLWAKSETEPATHLLLAPTRNKTFSRTQAAQPTADLTGLQAPIEATRDELPKRTLIDYEATANLVRETGGLLLPLDTPNLKNLRVQMCKQGVFSRHWVVGVTKTAMLLTPNRTIARRTKKQSA